MNRSDDHAKALPPASMAPCCRVCLSADLHAFVTVDEKEYWRCEACEAVLLDERSLPSRDQELEHYLKHENDPDDPRYRRFLSKLGDPLMTRLRPESLGLDYGCGPGPGLAAMLREQGHRIHTYDPFFAPDESVLSLTYDFIICSEVAEHFHNAAAEFERMNDLLKPGGWLGMMTCFRTEDRRFPDWHYRRDPTHVVFYKEKTIRLLAQRFGWACEIPTKDVALLRKGF